MPCDLLCRYDASIRFGGFVTVCYRPGIRRASQQQGLLVQGRQGKSTARVHLVSCVQTQISHIISRRHTCSGISRSGSRQGFPPCLRAIATGTGGGLGPCFQYTNTG